MSRFRYNWIVDYLFVIKFSGFYFVLFITASLVIVMVEENYQNSVIYLDLYITIVQEKYQDFEEMIE